MPTWSEIYLVGGLMLLTLIISVVSIYLFIRQYRREKAENVKRETEKEQPAPGTRHAGR